MPTAEGGQRVDLFEIALRDDPYPGLAQLREASAVHAGPYGYWYVSRYDDIQRLLRDPAMVSGTGVIDSLGLTSGPLFDVMTSWLMALDGDAHGRARRLISSVFTPRAVEGLRPRIEEIVITAIEGLQAGATGGRADVMAAMAWQIPMEVMRELFGVDAGEWQAGVVDACFAAGTPVAMMNGLTDYLSTLVDRRRSGPGSDVFSRLFAPDELGESLGDHELVANGVLLITAGFETTMSLLGNMLCCIGSRPEVRDAVRRDRSLIGAAVEETLRFETPALSTSRTTTAEVALGEQAIPAGGNVLFSLAAGNRDPRRFADPDRFDVARRDVRPLGFGGGLHVCIGAALARLEAQVTLAAMLDRFPSFGVDPATVSWRKDNPTVRGPASLPIRLA
jgi:cytochrome P450